MHYPRQWALREGVIPPDASQPTRNGQPVTDCPHASDRGEG